MCADKKAQANFFLWPAVANSGKRELQKLATACVIYFRNERRYHYRSWKISLLL